MSAIKKIEKQLPPFLTDKDTTVGQVVGSALEFANDSTRFVRGCKRPDAKEFKQIAFACSIGFAIMGFIGYFVKLVFIPVNNILIGSH